MVIHLYHLQVDHAPGFNCSEIAKQVALQEVTISQNRTASIHMCFVFFWRVLWWNKRSANKRNKVNYKFSRVQTLNRLKNLLIHSGAKRLLREHAVLFSM